MTRAERLDVVRSRYGAAATYAITQAAGVTKIVLRHPATEDQIGVVVPGESREALDRAIAALDAKVGAGHAAAL